MIQHQQDSIVSCSALCKTFHIAGDLNVNAVNDVALNVSEREIVVIHGSSGSGKTTLLMMLAGMLQPTSGCVELLNKDLYRQDSSERALLRRKSIGIVLPMFHLLPYLDAAANVALGSSKKHARKQAIDLLDRVGLADRARQLPDRMSAGERRRLIVARALIHDPKLLLADEPTSNLDDENAGVIRTLLVDHARQGNGVLIVTHEQPERFCATIVHEMSNGKLQSIAQTVG